MLATRIGIETINMVVRAFVEAFNPAGPVLDIGSYYPPGYAALCDRRPLFPGRTYIGCDIRRGPGVDRIEDAEHLSFADRSVGCVMLLETLEHLPYPHRAIGEAKRVLTDEGLILASVPFSYPLHGFPTDYWRFTASGLHTLLEDFPHRTVFAIGPEVRPSTVFAVATPGRTWFAENEPKLQAALVNAFRHHRRRHALKVLEERSRDLLGLLLGRARVGINFYDPNRGGGYRELHPVRK
jgi:SAM-dependent methyltransferase